MDSQVILLALPAVLAVAVIGAFLGNRLLGQEKRWAALAQTLDRLGAVQAEQAGRLQQLGESQAVAQAQLSHAVEQKLELVANRLGDGISHHTRATGETMTRLSERLAVIDAAQSKITQLSEQVVGLQDILSNKQARGAFGELQLEDLVSGILPPSAYAFQVTLSNKRRADCLLTLPNPPGSIVIDAKFPLESYNAFRKAETRAERTYASRTFDADVRTHVKAIAERYILPGETAESALMFLPSEAVYAELHANFRNVVEESFRRRVWIVSPTTLMATLNTVRAVLKDAHLREQAGVVQKELAALMKDVERLDERAGDLQRHHAQGGEDLRKIRISADKILRGAERIEEVQLGEDCSAGDLEPPKPGLDAA